MRTLIFAAAAAAVASLAASSAGAVVVTGLYNTGLGVGGVALAAGDGQTDGNYVVTAGTIPGVVTGSAAQTYFNGAYAAESTASRWISYSGSPFNGSGTVTLSTTFDLTGFDATTASISGAWGVDNEGEIFLNGVTTGITLTGITAANFNQLYDFTIASGFVSGVNTLSFAIFDGGSPAAVRADRLVLTADALTGGVPEAATWAMMIAGFGLVGAAARRRRMVVAA